MSHFTTVRTRLTEGDFVAAALRDLGRTFERGNVSVRGFNGATTACEFRVDSGVKGYDLGFRVADGRYELVADWYGLPSFNKHEFLEKLTQRYAYRVALDQLQRENFSVVEETKDADKTIRLVVRRMGE